MNDITVLAKTLRHAAEEELMCREASDTSDLWMDEAGPENVLALLDELEAAESKCRELAAENSALKNPDNWLSQSDYGYEAAEVATQNGATDDESLRAGMIAIINRIETPATETILAGVRSEVIEWLDAEISAIDPVYRGDPSYEHDACWMKNEVRDLVESAKKVFSCQQSQREAAQ
ncbi:hypothetical protein YN28_001614 [Salmonella enterica subsp. enterica]|nr:hypothetical protein [Salmonella enterica subsp. enterica]